MSFERRLDALEQQDKTGRRTIVVRVVRVGVESSEELEKTVYHDLDGTVRVEKNANFRNARLT